VGCFVFPLEEWDGIFVTAPGKEIAAISIGLEIVENGGTKNVETTQKMKTGRIICLRVCAHLVNCNFSSCSARLSGKDTQQLQWSGRKHCPKTQRQLQRIRRVYQNEFDECTNGTKWTTIKNRDTEAVAVSGGNRESYDASDTRENKDARQL